jgi:hypothetical protein
VVEEVGAAAEGLAVVVVAMVAWESTAEPVPASHLCMEGDAAAAGEVRLQVGPDVCSVRCDASAVYARKHGIASPAS